jgi:hypothetical protein
MCRRGDLNPYELALTRPSSYVRPSEWSSGVRIQRDSYAGASGEYGPVRVGPVHLLPTLLPTPSGVPDEVLSEASRFGARSGPVLTSRWSSGARTTLGHSASSPPTSPSAPGGDSARVPYVVCDTEGKPVTPEEARRVIAERFRVTDDVRSRRRSKKQVGKAPQKVLARQSKLSARGASERGDLPHGASSGDRRDRVKMPA